MPMALSVSLKSLKTKGFWSYRKRPAARNELITKKLTQSCIKLLIFVIVHLIRKQNFPKNLPVLSQVVRNKSFSENFAYVLNESSLSSKFNWLNFESTLSSFLFRQMFQKMLRKALSPVSSIDN